MAKIPRVYFKQSHEVDLLEGARRPYDNLTQSPRRQELTECSATEPDQPSLLVCVEIVMTFLAYRSHDDYSPVN